MNRDEAITILKDILWQMGSVKRWENIEAIDMAIEALQELPKRRKEAKRWKTKALQAEPVKHGEWELDPNGMDWNIPAWRCSECGFVANYIGVEVNGLSNNPMNWAGSNFCPNCGAKMNKE